MAAAPAISCVDVNTCHGDGQQTHGGEHAVAAADVVGHHEGLIALGRSARDFSAPLWRGRWWHRCGWRRPRAPYFFSSSSRKKRKATAGSVVVPDLEMTFTEKSTPSTSSMHLGERGRS